MPNIGSKGIFARHLGVWKPAEDVDARHLGAYAQAKEVHAKDAGVWVKVWEDNAPPNPVTGLTLSAAWSGADWTVTASWANPADIDLATAEVTFTVNGAADAPATQAAADTDCTRSVPANATVSASVRLLDTGGLYSVPLASAALTVGPGAVTGVSVAQVALDVVRLNYTAPAGATSVNLYRRLNGAAEVLSSLSAAGPWDDRIGVGASVTYRMVAVNAGRVGPSTATTAPAVAAAPAPTPSVASWSYTNVTLQWPAVANATQYAVLRNGIHVATVAGLSASVAVVKDTNYTFVVRAESNYNGVLAVGPWSAEVRVAIGHAAYSYTQAWSAAKSIVLYRGQMDGPVRPDNVAVNAIRFQNVDATGVGSLTSATRQLYYVGDSAVGYAVTGKPDPWGETMSWGPYFGAGGGIHGLYISGSGWTSAAGNPHLEGHIEIFGDETISVAELGNGYW